MQRFRTCVGVLVRYLDSDTYNSTFALVDALLNGPSSLKTESLNLLDQLSLSLTIRWTGVSICPQGGD